MSGKTKLLIALMTLLLLGNVAMVLMNLSAARNGMAADQAERLRALRESFDIAVYAAETKLTEIAAFSAQTNEVRDALDGAVQALRDNGGDPRAPEVEERRRALADVVGVRWSRLQFHYMLRQFGFYLPPHLSAFYRAEAPHRYGDPNDGVDALAAQVAKTGRPAAGFAVDGLTTGLRAAVPMPLGDSTAVLEVGTAYDPILAPICPNSHCGIAVLLPQDRTAARMSADDMAAQFTDNRRIGPWLIEASTNPAVTRALLSEKTTTRDLGPGSPIQIGARWYAAAAFPLRDHLGKDDDARGDAGMVLTWISVDEGVKALEEAEQRNIAGAAAAFAVISILAFWLVRLATSKLENEVRRRTSEVQSLLEEVSFLAERDPLTGLYNRRVFSQRLHQEVARAKRTGETFALVIIDLDHFKQINDRWGHPVGDEVLCLTGALIRENVRTQDVPARIGGEEFALLLPHTDAGGAAALTERLRQQLTTQSLTVAENESLTATFSAGVATWRPGVEEAILMRQADKALYAAKTAGRNRVHIGSSSEKA